MATFNFLNAVRNPGTDVETIEKLRYFLNVDEEVRDWKGSDSPDVLYPLSEALRFAIMYGNSKYCRYILSNFPEEALGVKTCCPLLLLAVRLNNEEIVEMLCSHGRSVRMSCGRYYIDSRGCDMMENGKTALHTAVELGHRGCTKILLRYGANHELVDSDGQTVLERACNRFKNKPSFALLMCVVDLIECEQQLQPKDVGLLKGLYDHWSYPACFAKVPLTFEVSKLMHLCRYSVRLVLQRSLPNSIEELPIPNIAKQYLDVRYTAGDR